MHENVSVSSSLRIASENEEPPLCPGNYRLLSPGNHKPDLNVLLRKVGQCLASEVP